MDTACSSSLVAVHMAVQTLRAGESRVAVACGSNLLLGPENFVVESKLKMLSPVGQSKMWDRDADGYARGDGVGAVIMKTLSQAIADGDNIDCIIRETSLNQDGATTGITMPSSVAQRALILSTYRKAGLNIQAEEDRPQYFEAHGTGKSHILSWNYITLLWNTIILKNPGDFGILDGLTHIRLS
jgi:acyl transferase domain-containing protein